MLYSNAPKEMRTARGSSDRLAAERNSEQSFGPLDVEWMTIVKDWAGVMISAQTLIGRCLVRMPL